jgi:hypothetical protein
MSETNPNLSNEIYFVNIGRQDEDFLTWKNPRTDKVFTKLDAIGLRTFRGDVDYYRHVKDPRHETKTVVKQFVKDPGSETIFIVVAGFSCQYQVIEAFIEYLVEKWFAVYDSSLIKSVGSGGEMFGSFNSIIEEAFSKMPDRDLKKVQALCKPTNELIDVWVKRSLVTKASSLPAALVFEHGPYHLLLYLDGQFKVREQKLVDFSA